MKSRCCPFCNRPGRVHETCVAQVLSRGFGLQPEVIRLPSGKKDVGYRDGGELLRKIQRRGES